MSSPPTLWLRASAQALTLAGGATERAAMNRIQIKRLDKGKPVTIKNVKLTDILRPGDSVVVPERYMH